MADRNNDPEARAAREMAELAAVSGNGAHALEACRRLAELFRAGYRVVEVGDASVIEARPVRFVLRKSDANCAECTKYLPLGTPVWWTRGHTGVECVECHEGEAA